MRPTDIEWCDYSANPIKLKLHESGKFINVCVKCSPGCGNCYAESIIRHWWRKDWGKFPGYSAAILKLGDIVVQDAELRAMLTFKPKGPFKHGAKRPSVFVEDMGDLFGPWVPFELIDRCFAAFALRHDIDWLILTKRIDRALEYLKRGYFPICDVMQKTIPTDIRMKHLNAGAGGVWPLPNVWLGTSVEDQKRADERIPVLLKCPTAKRFLSCEPLLGPVDISKWMWPTHWSWDAKYRTPQEAIAAGAHAQKRRQALVSAHANFVDWVIAGGESGPGARPMHPDWARGLRDQCVEAGVPFFFKQWGTFMPWSCEHSTNEKAAKLLRKVKLRVRMMPDGTFPKAGTPCTREQMDLYMREGVHMVRVGKEEAGRLLDGREWNQKPGVEARSRQAAEAIA